jgi:phosphatidylglycerophosphatase A
MKIRPKLVEGIATAGYIGYLPKAPGTFGSLIGCLIYPVMPLLPKAVVFLGLIGFFFFSAWIAGKAEKILHAKDPGCIVIDEIVGMAVTYFALPFSAFIGIAGFVIFRFFDILKPYPIKLFEQKCPGGIGVVIDDVIAGIFSNIVLQLIVLGMKYL